MLEEKEQKLVNEINDGITALRAQQAAFDTSFKSAETKASEQKALIDKITLKLDEIEVQQKKTIAIASGEKSQSPEHKAYLNWLRTAESSEHLRRIKGEKPEAKVITTGDTTSAGYLTSPEMGAGILKTEIEFSPIRALANVKPTSGESYKQRKRTGIATGGRSGETETRVATTGLAFGMEEIPTHEYYAFDDISRWNLEDSEFNIEGELDESFGETLGVLEGYDFVLGNAVKRPEGFMVNSGVGYVAGGDANLITGDSFFKLYFAPKTAYLPRAVYVMNRATMLAASLLKESTTGNYLLRRLGESPQWYILGQKVVEAKDMPAIAANAYPVAFGDFFRAYTIVDRTSLVTLRDPFTQATSGAVRFYVFKRTGGQVVQAECIYKLKIATS